MVTREMPRIWTLRAGTSWWKIAPPEVCRAVTLKAVEAEPVADLLEGLVRLKPLDADEVAVIERAEALLRHLGRDV
jgi:hypothetical protein